MQSSVGPEPGAEGDPRFDRPIIIVSPPRSGGRLLYETLAQAPGVFTIGDGMHTVLETIRGLRPIDNDWHSNELTAEHATPRVIEAGRNAYFAELRDRNEQPPPMNGTRLRLLEQTPKNALRIGFLDRVFPDALFVYLLRDPRDEISSMIDAWRSGRFATYPELPGWEGIPWSLPLIPGWHDLIGKSVQEICAAQWKYTTSKILDDLTAIAPGRWTAVRHHSLTSNPQIAVEQLCRTLGIAWVGPLDGPLPVSRHSLTPPSPDKWRANATELNEVLTSVAESAQRATVVAAQLLGEAPADEQATGPTTTAPSDGRRHAAVESGPHPMGSLHTPSVPELLGATGLSLLMSTYQSGKVVTLREMGGSLNTHFTAVTRPMGIAWRPGGVGAGASALSIGTRNEVWTYRNQPAVAAKIQPSGTYGAAYILRSRHVTGDISIHEMAYAGDGELWIVNTRFSCLCTLDAEHSFVPRWTPPFISGLGADDRCHLNGMAMRNGVPRYVSMFGESDRSQGWRDAKAFGGLVMDMESGEVVSSGLCMPHSPRWYRDQLFVLESGKGTLSRVDLDTGECEVVVKLPGFTRGLAFIGRYAVVGLSQVRESVFAGIPLTTTNEPRHSGVWIVDLESAEVVGFVRFDGLVQEVFDLQVVTGGGSGHADDGTPVGRHVHLMEIDDELLAKSFVVPAEQ